jgi:hypothetical protein
MAIDTAEEDTCAAIGRFVSEFSLLEETLRFIIGIQVKLRMNLQSDPHPRFFPSVHRTSP